MFKDISQKYEGKNTLILPSLIYFNLTVLPADLFAQYHHYYGPHENSYKKY